jgi:hypothetical protein
MRSKFLFVVLSAILFGGCASIDSPEKAIAVAAKACPDYHITVEGWEAARERWLWKVSPRDGTAVWVNVQKIGPTTSNDCRLTLSD